MERRIVHRFIISHQGYDPTFATADKDSAGKALAAPGDKIATATQAVRSVFGNGSVDTQKLDDIKKVEISKTQDGYTLKYGKQNSLSLTRISSAATNTRRPLCEATATRERLHIWLHGTAPPKTN